MNATEIVEGTQMEEKQRRNVPIDGFLLLPKYLLKWKNQMLLTKTNSLFPPGFEPGTFRVLDGCDNHYTTETSFVGLENCLVPNITVFPYAMTYWL